MAIDGSRIQRITAEGLFYLDENDQEQFIDFQACYKRQFSRFMEPERLKRYQEINHMTEEQLEKSIQRRKNAKMVADRNVIGRPMGTAPYIEFYTDPPIRFEFATKEAFNEIRMRIEFLAPMPPNSATQEELDAFFADQTGWLTFDLS
jgi:hypothetical protein